MTLSNTSGDSRDLGVLIENMYTESYALTGEGGHIELIKGSNLSLFHSTMNSGAGNPAAGDGRCVKIIPNGAVGSCWANIGFCYLRSTIPVTATANPAGFNFYCVYAPGSVSLGWKNTYGPTIL
jgi:hypothetical protein